MIEYKKHLLPREIFGERLKELRDELLLSTLNFSRIFENKPNTSKTSLYRLERGELSQSMYERVADTVERVLPEWLRQKGYTEEEIFDKLDRLFNYQERDMIIKRRELTSAAVKFFGFKADPFDVDRVPGDDELFTNTELDEVAAQVRDAVLYKKWVVVHGPIGSGKTSLKIRVARELANSKKQVHLIYPEFFDMNSVSVQAIASCILEEFGIRIPVNKISRVRKIKEILTQYEKEDARVALVFDECHRLNDKVLISLKNFWEMTNGGYSRLLGVVLFGQPQFVNATLREARYREIAERVKPVEMPNLDKSAKDYLAHKIASVGGDINKLFEDKAVTRICNVARTPLSLGNLANHALMEAFTKYEETVVTARMLDSLNLPDAPRVRQIRTAA